jgi:hypothetical protein
MHPEIWQNKAFQRWSQLLLDSYEILLNRPLLERQPSKEAEIHKLFHAPFVVVSHGLGDDPILNYGNQTALDLWEMTWEQLIQTPSRQTAEPQDQDVRAQTLVQVARQGYIENYEGVRISSTGKRFLIQNVVIWNLLDGVGTYWGQAATFDRWTFL